MSFPRFAVLGALSLSAGAWVGCGSNASHEQAGSQGGGTTTTTATGSGAAVTTTTTIVDAGPDVNDGVVSSTYPASFPNPPQVQAYGGPVLASPRFVPVFFAGDDTTYVTALTDFDTKVGGSAYWKTATSEYGVGAGVATAAIMLTEAAPTTIDDTGIQTWLEGKLNGNDAAWPANDANTVYVLHYPSTTTITQQNATSCTEFGGYHSNITLDANHGSADAAYAVIPRCTDFPPLTGIDAVTGTESHELVEAATDPYPMTNPAYASVDDGHFFWERALGGGEVGDMCAQFPNVWNKWPDLSYTVQSIWSNANAKAGHNPCQPVPMSPYVAAAPVLKDTVTNTFGGMSLTQVCAKIPVGGTGTVDIALFSDAASGPFTVAVEDYQTLIGGTALLSMSLDNTTGQNGQTLHATVTVKTAGKHNTEPFLVTAKLNGQENIWVGQICN